MDIPAIKQLMNRLLISSLQQKGLLEVPPKGKVYVFMAEKVNCGGVDFFLGTVPIEVVAEAAGIPVDQVAASLEALGGQGIFALYSEGAQHFSDIIEVRAQFVGGKQRHSG